MGDTCRGSTCDACINCYDDFEQLSAGLPASVPGAHRHSRGVSRAARWSREGSDRFPGERLVVCFNPRLEAERRRKREDLLRCTEKRLETVVGATRRDNRPLRGTSAIERRVGKVIGRFKVGKHFRTETTDTSFAYRRDEESIAEEQALDGLYIVRTNAEPALLSADEAVRAYKSLSTVERAFRSMKAVDLRVRPIFHRRPERVRAHIFLCMLAYHVEWHLRKTLAPMLFQDHDPGAGDRERSSPVEPARRSPEARRKAAARQTPDGCPLLNFGTLLQDLGTVTLNTARVAGKDATFTLRGNPTPVQANAFNLLGFSPSV